jgi:hypothetical protein
VDKVNGEIGRVERIAEITSSPMRKLSAKCKAGKEDTRIRKHLGSSRRLPTEEAP